MLETIGVPPNQTGCYCRGDGAIAAGMPFGDGLRCTSGNVVRLEIVTANGAGIARSSASLGSGLLPGDAGRYQLWYRDPVGGPCGNRFNLSNGLEVTWGA